MNSIPNGENKLTVLCISCPGCFRENFIDSLQLHINNCKSVYNPEGKRVTLQSLDTQEDIHFDSLFEPYASDNAFTKPYGTNNKALRIDIQALDEQCRISYQVLTSQAIYDQWKEEGIIGSPSVMRNNFESNRVTITPFCEHQTFVRQH